jgi:hypothetical protein
MADREQSQTPKTGTGDKTLRRHVPKTGEVIGRNVPDESKEHHTEIAVEAGRTVGDRHSAKK